MADSSPLPRKRSRSGALLLGMAAGLGFGIALFVGLIALIGAVLYYAGGGFHSNSAEDEGKPLMSELKQVGLASPCGQGDNGHSLSNNVPWHQWFLTGDEERALATVEAWAEEEGWTVGSAGEGEAAGASVLFYAEKGTMTLDLIRTNKGYTCSWEELDERESAEQGLQLSISDSKPTS